MLLECDKEKLSTKLRLISEELSVVILKKTELDDLLEFTIKKINFIGKMLNYFKGELPRWQAAQHSLSTNHKYNISNDFLTSAVIMYAGELHPEGRRQLRLGCKQYLREVRPVQAADNRVDSILRLVGSLTPSQEIDTCVMIIEQNPLPCVVVDPYQLLYRWLAALPGAFVMADADDFSRLPPTVAQRYLVSLNCQVSLLLDGRLKMLKRNHSTLYKDNRIILRVEQFVPAGYDNVVRLDHVHDHLSTELAVCRMEAAESLDKALLTKYVRDS